MAPATRPGHTLPVGASLRDHEITGLIGEGGFGIVYLAYDRALQRSVAIKEYMPSSMAARAQGGRGVVVKSERHRETFEAGLKSFVNEARLLARFDHPALVKVYRFWEENGTAYMVMPYYEGPTLKCALAALGHAPDEAALRAWLEPLLDALAVMHAAHCYHRDIAPDNILLTAAGPLLLDFGAARHVISDMTHALTVVLKPGYAPIEQYGEVATMLQGAWTDLYALACVVYSAISGHAPLSSVERLIDDRLEPLGRVAAGRYSAGLLQAIDAALAVRPQDRPQDVAHFRALLDGTATDAEDARGAPHAAAPAMPPEASAAAPASRPSDAGERLSTIPTLSTPSTFPISTTLSTSSTLSVPPTSSTSSTRSTSSTPGGFSTQTRLSMAAALPAIRANRRTAIAGGALVLSSVLTAGGLYFHDPRTALPVAPIPALTPAAQSVSPAAITPVPTPASLSTAGPRVELPRATPAAAEAKPSRAFVPASPPPERIGRVAVAAPPPNPAARTAPAPLRAGVPQPERNATTSAARSVAQSPCTDVLQKASLEPLSAEETAFLKRECR